MEEDKNGMIFEMKKDILVDHVMQLLDLNGTSSNFQTDFAITIKDPSKKILVCVVNQEELDNGEINFERSEDGKYSRRVTFCENKHINHFIACKKDPSDQSPEKIECNVVVRLKKLPNSSPPTPPPTPNLNHEIDQKTREELQKQLLALSQSEKYKQAPEVEVINHSSFYNKYFIIGVICLAAFFYMLYKNKKK